MHWNMASRQSLIPESELPYLHQKAVDLLDILQQNLPDNLKTGETSKWNFEKAHTILHKVREIVLWGNMSSPRGMCQYALVCTSTNLHVLSE
jgi:hypothetical protein